MDLPNWVYLLGVVLVNVFLLLLICIIVLKNKESDIEIQNEIFKTEKQEKEEVKEQIKEEIKEELSDNAKAMNDIYEAMKKSSEMSKVERFEQEQEENAIISYQELLKFKNEQEQLKKEEKRYPKTEVISPIYGRVDEIKEQVKEETYELEKTLNMEPLRKEVKETEEFLNALKDFRKNL